MADFPRIPTDGKWEEGKEGATGRDRKERTRLV